MVQYLLPNEEEDKEPILSVGLERGDPELDDQACVFLMVDGYYVAGLTSDGRLSLYNSIPQDIGLETTVAGYIKVVR